jgi:hypothetical protein
VRIAADQQGPDAAGAGRLGQIRDKPAGDPATLSIRVHEQILQLHTVRSASVDGTLGD